MAEHNDLGNRGEELAAEYLENNGYNILDRKWQYQKAEIDLIATKGDILAVVEVKTRSSIDFGLPQDFVNKKKIRLLVAAINEYVNINDLSLEVRFDIIAVLQTPTGMTVEHIEDAFYHF